MVSMTTRTAADEQRAQEARQRRASLMAATMLLTDKPPHPTSLMLLLEAGGADSWRLWARQAGVSRTDLYVDIGGAAKVTERREAALAAYAAAWALRQPADVFTSFDDDLSA
jgi:hypothetical protein